MRSEQHKKHPRQHSGAGASPHESSASRADRGWLAVLAWAGLSVVAFVILFRLGLRAAQARRVGWLLGIAGAICTASRALFAEVRASQCLTPAWFAFFGGVGGLGVACLFGDANGVSLLAGAVFGGLLAWLGCHLR